MLAEYTIRRLLRICKSRGSKLLQTRLFVACGNCKPLTLTLKNSVVRHIAHTTLATVNLYIHCSCMFLFLFFIFSTWKYVFITKRNGNKMQGPVPVPQQGRQTVQQAILQPPTLPDKKRNYCTCFFLFLQHTFTLVIWFSTRAHPPYRVFMLFPGGAKHTETSLQATTDLPGAGS